MPKICHYFSLDRRSALALPHWEFQDYMQEINAIEAERRLSIMQMGSLAFNGYGKKGSSDYRANKRYVESLQSVVQGDRTAKRRKTNLKEMQRKIDAGETVENFWANLDPAMFNAS